MTLVQVQRRPRGTTDWKPIDDFVSWECTPETIDMTIPSAKIVLVNRNGRYSTKIRTRDEFRILIDRKQLFHGVMKDDTRKIGEELLEVSVSQKDYQTAIDKLCSDAYKQLGYSGWKWGSATQIGRTIVGGLRPDQVFQAGLGTRFFVQTFFESHTVISTFNSVAIEENVIELSREVVSGTERWVATGDVTFQDFHNVLIGYDSMPDIGDVDITIAGDEPAGTSLSLDISRDGGSTFVTKVPSFSGGSWTASVLEGEWAATATRNLLVVKVTLNANGSQTSSPILQSLTVEGDIRDPAGKGDLGLAEGIIDVFSDPDGLEDEIGADFSRQTRMDVMQGAVKGALSPAAEVYPSFFGFIKDGAAHFRNPATFGTDKSDTVIFSRELGTCEDTQIERKGSSIINNLMYIGQGIPPFGEITLTANDIAGLKNNASIADFGEVQGTVQEKGIPSLTFADKRARILAKHLAQPQVSYSVVNPDPKLLAKVELGDRVGLLERRFDADGTFIVLEKVFKWDGSLTVDVKISNNKVTARSFVAQIGQQQQSQNLIGQGSMSPPALSFSDNFDKDHPAELAFWLPPAAQIRAVHGYFKSGKFRANSQAAASGEIGASTTEGGGDHNHNNISSSGTHSHSLSAQGSHTHSAGVVSSGGGSGDTTKNGVTQSRLFRSSNVPSASLALTTTGWTSIGTFNCGFTASDVDWGMAFITGFNDAGNQHRWRARISGVTQGGGVFAVQEEAMGASSGHTADSVSTSLCILTWDTQPGSSVTVELQSIGGDFTDDFAASVIFVENHTHNRQAHSHDISIGSSGTHSHSVSAQGAHTHTIQASGNHQHAIQGTDHTHPIDYGIFEPNLYPEGVQMFIKDYPNVGDNPDENNLTEPFGPFGTRGTEGSAFEVQNIDMSAGFRDGAGDFKTGQLMKVWLKSVGSSGNADGLGRLVGSLFIDVLEGTDE